MCDTLASAGPGMSSVNVYAIRRLVTERPPGRRFLERVTIMATRDLMSTTATNSRVRARNWIRRFAVRAVATISILAAGGCPAPTGDDSGTDPGTVGTAGTGGSIGTSGDGLTAEQKLRADRLISVFENDTIELQYAYIEDIGDGRGFTAGRAGFTTATGDFLEVVERYTTEVPANGLAGFLPRLRELSAKESADTSGLEGLPEAWADAANDSRFRKVQDDVVSVEYYEPALEEWRELGLTTPLALFELYDANIQHGPGDDPDGVPAMIQRTIARAGGTPKTGVNEIDWFFVFLDVRLKTLENSSNPDTREAWRESTYRVEIVVDIGDADNFDFNGPIVIDTPEHQATIP
jgi:chitosanase